MRRNSTAAAFRPSNAAGPPGGSPAVRACPGPTRTRSPAFRRALEGDRPVHWRAHRLGIRPPHPGRGSLARAEATRRPGFRSKSRTRSCGRGLLRCLARAAEDPRNGNPGLFCCGKCSVGLWRNLLAGGLDRQEERLRHGARHLRSMRDGAHQWRRFPFWYTVLALSEMDSAEARAELKYAAPALEQAASRAVPSSVYARRRHEVASRALDAL